MCIIAFAVGLLRCATGDEDDGLNTNVFASADEFSHLMEDEAAALGGKGNPRIYN